MILFRIYAGNVKPCKIAKSSIVDYILGLYLRAWKIYRINIIIILSFLLLGYLPFINVFEVTHFTDCYSGTTLSLYPVTPQIKEPV